MNSIVGQGAPAIVGAGNSNVSHNNEGPTPALAAAPKKLMDTKLSAPDAHRYRALLDEAVERMSLLGMIMNDAASTRRREETDAATDSRKDIVSMMASQKHLESQFDELMTKRAELSGLSNKNKYNSTQATLSNVTADLRNSTSTICQSLKEQPSATGNLNKIIRDRLQLQELLEVTSEELKEESYDHLVNQVHERLQEQLQLGEMKLTQEKTAIALRALENEIEQEWSQFEADMESRTRTIQKLTADYKLLRKTTEMTERFEQSTAISRAQTLARQRQDRLDDLRRQIAELQQARDLDDTVHQRTRTHLTLKKDNLDRLGEYWENRYENDFAAKTTQLAELTDQRDRKKRMLVVQQLRWSEDQEEKRALMEEMKRREIEEDGRRKLNDLMTLAQCKIRFFWRCYLRRKAAAKKKKRKKKKKKKGTGSPRRRR